MVDVHVCQPILRPVAARADVVVGDAGHGHLLGWSARAGDHVFDLVAVVLVVPPGRHLVAGPGLLDPGSVPETHLAPGRNHDVRADVAVPGRKAVGPDVRRFHDMVVDADDLREISD